MRLACLSNHGCCISRSLWRRLWVIVVLVFVECNLRVLRERMSSAALLIPLIPHSGSVSLASRLLREAFCPGTTCIIHVECVRVCMCVSVYVKEERTRKCRGWSEIQPCWIWLPVKCVFSAFSHSSEYITPQCFLTSLWMLFLNLHTSPLKCIKALVSRCSNCQTQCVSSLEFEYINYFKVCWASGTTLLWWFIETLHILTLSRLVLPLSPLNLELYCTTHLSETGYNVQFVLDLVMKRVI